MIGIIETRKASPSHVTDAGWAFVARSPAPRPEGSGQRVHDLRQVDNARRPIVKTGEEWRMMPHHLPPRAAVSREAPRWVSARVFEPTADDLRAIVRVAVGQSHSRICYNRPS